MYSPDLVKSAATWAHRNRQATPGARENGLAVSKEWERVAPTTLKLPPRYSEAYKKRMDMPAHFHPETGPGNSASSPPVSNAPSYSSNTSTGTSASLLADQDYFGLGLGGREGEDRFRSLTDLKWGEFESMGFSGLGDEKKLQFDLTESARSVSPLTIPPFAHFCVSIFNFCYVIRNALQNVPRSLGTISRLLGSHVQMPHSVPLFSLAPLSPRLSPLGLRTTRKCPKSLKRRRKVYLHLDGIPNLLLEMKR